MRILMTCSVPGEWGTFIRLLRYGTALSKRGHQVTLLRQGQQVWFPQVEWRDNLRILIMPRLRGDRWLPKSLRPNDILFRCIHVLRERYDVHHAFQEFENVAWPWQLSRRLQRARLHIYDADDLWVDGGYLKTESDHQGIWRWHYRRVANIERQTRVCADGMTVVSEFLRERAIAMGMPANNILLLRPGIAIQSSSIAQRQAVRERWRVPAQTPVLAFTGFGQQDIHEVIQICQLLAIRNIDFYFVLIGPDGAGAATALKQAGLDTRATITGALPAVSVNALLAGADIALLPYPDNLLNRSRWPTKLSDYLAAGLPVLAGPAGNLATQLEQLGAGAGYTDIESAVTTLLAWLQNPEQLLKMRNRALAAAQEHYNIDVQAACLEKFYLDLLTM